MSTVLLTKEVNCSDEGLTPIIGESKGVNSTLDKDPGLDSTPISETLWYSFSALWSESSIASRLSKLMSNSRAGTLTLAVLFDVEIVAVVDVPVAEALAGADARAVAESLSWSWRSGEVMLRNLMNSGVCVLCAAAFIPSSSMVQRKGDTVASRRRSHRALQVSTGRSCVSCPGEIEELLLSDTRGERSQKRGLT